MHFTFSFSTSCTFCFPPCPLQFFSLALVPFIFHRNPFFHPFTYCSARVLTLRTDFTTVLTVLITRNSTYLRLVLASWLLLLDEDLLVQLSESLKRFQTNFEDLHRLHLSPWAYASWPSVVYPAAFLQWFSFPTVFVDPVSVSLLDLVVTWNGRRHTILWIHGC